MTKVALAALGLIAGLYLVVLVALAVAQRSLIYPAPPAPGAGASAVPPGFTSIALETADGLSLHAAYRAAVLGRQTLVFFHGNGSSIDESAVATDQLGARGYGLLLVEYRGYRGNPGKPSEAGLYADGRAALAWLGMHGVATQRTVLIGNSLGSGVATELAARMPVAGLVLISGFTSLPDVAAGHYPWLPVRLMLRDRFDNRAKLAKVAAPVLVLHGTADTLIPADQGRALAAAAPHATLELVSGYGHELAFEPEAQTRTLAWLQRLQP
ncbi:alpha/beta hydrolase [Sphingomonas sp. R-74633]|uniref:alpha/beta hydrolase n=1 Tax=Sphingomonas sp. R-74633 TaxID=2751188 RepID=UPI0015D40A62|nr:alpha/beta hydrolase [Sphingomonas sp. R-74633]